MVGDHHAQPCRADDLLIFKPNSRFRQNALSPRFGFLDPPGVGRRAGGGFEDFSRQLPQFSHTWTPPRREAGLGDPHFVDRGFCEHLNFSEFVSFKLFGFTRDVSLCWLPLLDCTATQTWSSESPTIFCPFCGWFGSIQQLWTRMVFCSSQKKRGVQEISARNCGAGNGCANFMGAWHFLVLSAGKPPCP